MLKKPTLEEVREFRRMLNSRGFESSFEEAVYMQIGLQICLQLIRKKAGTIDGVIDEVQLWAASEGLAFHPGVCKVLLEERLRDGD